VIQASGEHQHLSPPSLLQSKTAAFLWPTTSWCGALSYRGVRVRVMVMVRVRVRVRELKIIWYSLP
jgi:hypothetical protein